MNGWPSLLPVGIAGIVALLLIGGSLYSTSGETKNKTATTTHATIFTRSLETDESWQSLIEAIAGSATTSPVAFRAPAELSTTNAIAQELVATEARIARGELSGYEINQELALLAKRNVKPINPSDSYTLSSLNVRDTTPLEQYLDNLGSIMQAADSIDEYELTVFARTLRADIHSGTPTLTRDATVYRDIERKLVSMPVPKALGPAHLAYVKSVAFLALSVELMGGWTGDSYDALTYIDAFIRADKGVQTALGALGDAIIKLNKAP